MKAADHVQDLLFWEQILSMNDAVQRRCYCSGASLSATSITYLGISRGPRPPDLCTFAMASRLQRLFR